MTRRIAIIPARGGSKRIPNKNIRNFCGQPMITHILQAAQESELFEVIHVSTESLLIREAVENFGVGIEFMRPVELADDHTPIMPVLKYVAETYASRGQLFDQVWLLMACAPLVESADLQQAAQLFDQTGGTNPVLAISEYPVPIEWAFSRALDGKLTPVQPGMFAVRSQDIAKKYFDAGAFTAFPTATVQASEGAGSDVGFVGHILPKGKAIDIDDEADWALAEAMHRSQRQVFS
jgi:pseudaminic acid cytidylyltransferase